MSLLEPFPAHFMNFTAHGASSKMNTPTDSFVARKVVTSDRETERHRDKAARRTSK